ncbi:MAG: F0F1 ATP synthase subunit epsilon [Candidatus Latescibacteria bacterium]|nr:F0F1 ATP synthase subunit epsilon [Candidatus Latescibacterota bacterium]
MPGTFHLSLLTPQRSLLETEVESIVAPGSEGYLGILAHHAPLITALQPGRLEIRDAAREEQVFAVSGGFLEVSNNRATVLADAVERPDEIDVARAERALERARERKKDLSGAVDAARAEAALRRAVNRIRVARER